MKIIAVIPTYNESGTIADIIKAVFSVDVSKENSLGILVVDDSSPDGTADIVHALQKTYSSLSIVSGKKVGLGAAYIRGISYALATLKADCVIQMDADFSHDPNDIPRLIEGLGHADMVIGSRYVSGGTIPREWGIVRKLNSRVGNMVARYVAGLYPIRDCTAGFRAIHARILKSVDFSAVKVQGYVFQVALLHAIRVQGAIIKEIPVDFRERTIGVSKLGLKDVIEFILNCWWIRLQRFETFLRFSVVGLSGVVVNLSTFSLCIFFGIHPFVASPIAIELSIISNFAFNNFWTFKKRDTGQGIYMKGLKFNIVSLGSLVISYGTFLALSSVFPHISPLFNQAAGIVPAMIVNYLFNSYWTFKSRSEGTL
ncbi:MAG: hypothetical protein RLZZ67_108 [Candidatus Parcubacteria bacterium]|jgi:dolichol-phosphate mannosyltransferase